MTQEMLLLIVERQLEALFCSIGTYIWNTIPYICLVLVVILITIYTVHSIRKILKSKNQNKKS
jgi:heme exporter protein D